MAYRFDRLPLTKDAVLGIPDDPGVYVLWAGLAPLHIGSTDRQDAGLRTLLQRHLVGVLSPSPPQATHLTFEVTPEPRLRHIALVSELARRF